MLLDPHLQKPPHSPPRPHCKLGYTDATYTAAVDSGAYSNFTKDSAGYGLAQWTYWSRKEALLNYARGKKKSVGDLTTQRGFLMEELTTDYKAVLADGNRNLIGLCRKNQQELYYEVYTYQPDTGFAQVLSYQLAKADSVDGYVNENFVRGLYAGETVEEVDAADFAAGGLRHPYTRALWNALPQNGFTPIPGTQPYPGELAEGCQFAPRCPRRRPECRAGTLPTVPLRGGAVRCRFPEGGAV